MNQSELLKNKNTYQQACGGTYLILPLYNYSKGNYEKLISELNYQLGEVPSADFTPFLARLCRSGGFIHRYNKSIAEGVLVTKEANRTRLKATNYDLFIFQNEIAFMSIYFEYKNQDILALYDKIQPGYLTGNHNDIAEFVKEELEKLNNISGLNFQLYGADETDNDDAKSTIFEHYCFNIAMVNERFKHLETIDQLAFNLYKMVPLTDNFVDESQKDIAYTYGGRDVHNKTYRWGACITSQSISYVYAGSEEDNLQENADDDYLLTMLALNQKYFCMGLNDELFKALSDKNLSTKKMSKLQRKALEFRATGTLAPTQVSRWYNVCETYRHLVQLNGVEEALGEIEYKLELIKADQTAQVERIQGFIAGGVTLFGPL